MAERFTRRASLWIAARPQSAKSDLTDLLMFKAVFRIDQFRIEVFQLPLPPPRLSFAVRVSRRT
jgi:hypothetical protein